MRPATPIDRRVMREMNQSTLLNLIRTQGPISRSQLVALSGLSVGTVVTIISELIKRRVVVEQGIAESTSGRKASLLELDPEGAYVVGLHLLADGVAAVLLNPLGEIVLSEYWEAPLRNHAETAVKTIAERVEAFLERSTVSREKILGLGCGSPGCVNAHTGVCVDNWIHNWHDLPLATPLAQALNMPVFLDNIVSCLGSYEQLFGVGKHYQNFLVVTLGRGVGLSVTLHGDIHRGSWGGGSEFGHIPVIPNGRLCECGNRGCLEAYVADHGLLTSYHERRQYAGGDTTTSPELTLSELYSPLQGTNALLHSVFTEAGQLLGISVATLINLFNPECIIITGNNVDPRNPLFASLERALQKTLQQYTFSRLGENLKQVIEPVTDMQWAQGAGCLVLRYFFLSPVFTSE